MAKDQTTADLILELAKSIHDGAKGYQSLAGIGSQLSLSFDSSLSNAVRDYREGLRGASRALQAAIDHDQELEFERGRQLSLSIESAGGVDHRLAVHQESGETYAVRVLDNDDGEVIAAYYGPIDKETLDVEAGKVGDVPLGSLEYSTDEEQLEWIRSERADGAISWLDDLVEDDGEQEIEEEVEDRRTTPISTRRKSRTRAEEAEVEHEPVAAKA